MDVLLHLGDNTVKKAMIAIMLRMVATFVERGGYHWNEYMEGLLGGGEGWQSSISWLGW